MRAPLRLAQEMGKGLGRGPVLFRPVSGRPEIRHEIALKKSLYPPSICDIRKSCFVATPRGDTQE